MIILCILFIIQWIVLGIAVVDTSEIRGGSCQSVNSCG